MVSVSGSLQIACYLERRQEVPSSCDKPRDSDLSLLGLALDVQEGRTCFDCDQSEKLIKLFFLGTGMNRRSRQIYGHAKKRDHEKPRHGKETAEAGKRKYHA